MKKQTSEIIKDILQKVHDDASDPLHECALGYSMKAYDAVESLLQDEKKKWKEEVMKAIGEDEVMPTIIETPETEFLIKKIPAHIGRNEFRQQLRVKLNKV